MIAAALGIAVLFAAPKPADAIVINNGLIVVVNDTGKGIAGAQIWHWNTTRIDYVASLNPGQIWHANGCCAAAGSEYTLDLTVWVKPAIGGSEPVTRRAVYRFIPKLCNRNGIPYGFAKLVVMPDGPNNYKIERIDPNSCYEGPL